MELEKKQKLKKAIVKLIISGIIIAGLIVGIYFIFKALGWDRFSSRDELQKFIASFGPIGPVIYVIASFLQVTFIPIPASVTIIAGTFLFGPYLAFAYSYLGIMLGAILAFGLGRWLGRKYVNWLAGGEKEVDFYLEKFKDRTNIIFFFCFLLPFFPDDFLCSLAGITPMTWKTYIIMQLFTRATSIIFTILFMSGEYIPYSGWGIPVLVVIGVLAVAAFILSMVYTDKIYEIVNKISKKFKKKSKREVEVKKNIISSENKEEIKEENKLD